ncbi:MAG: hypothetical protein JNM45_08325 [Rhizobiales bacterium]|nr:hypothetical protein [Hyphomicrobiales bacterium]
MFAAFGTSLSSLAPVEVEAPSPLAPAEDMARVRSALSGLTQASMASLRFYRPQATAAFSPRDTSHPAHGAVMAMLAARGFQPGERGAGGQLAVYDEAALVIDLIAPHPDPRENTRDRYRHFSALMVKAISSLGIDARVGEVAGEYCPGDYSVNAGGRVKLAGLAQRIGKHGYHMGAVISIAPSPAARDAVTEAYRMMDIPFAPETFGAITDLAPGVSAEETCRHIAHIMTEGLTRNAP